MIKQKLRIIFIILLLPVIALGQNQAIFEDGTFANLHPQIFAQNADKKAEALALISSYTDSIGKQPSVIPGLYLHDFASDIRYLINHPNRTLLNYNGNYCAAIAVINWLLNNRPEVYTQLVFELAIHGFVQTKQNRKIKVPKQLKNLDFSRIDSLPLQRNLIDSTRISDFLLGVSMIYTKKKLQRIGLIWKDALYNKNSTGNFIFGNSAPWEMDNYIKMAGFTVCKKRYYLGCKNNKSTLEYLDKQINQHEMPIVLENHLLTATETRNILYRISGAHFITIHGMHIYENSGTIELSYWDYGKVSNKREQTTKSTSYAHKKALKQATTKHGNAKNMSFNTFYKGIKGYWIIENNP